MNADEFTDLAARFRSPRRLRPSNNTSAHAVWIQDGDLLLEDTTGTSRVHRDTVRDLAVAQYAPTFSHPGGDVLFIHSDGDEVVGSLVAPTIGAERVSAWVADEVEAFAAREGLAVRQLGRCRRRWVAARVPVIEDHRSRRYQRVLMWWRSGSLFVAFAVGVAVAMLWPAPGAVGFAMSVGIALFLWAVTTADLWTVKESGLIDRRLFDRDDVAVLGEGPSRLVSVLADHGEVAAYVPGFARLVVGEVAHGVHLRWQPGRVVLASPAESRVVEVPLEVDREQAVEFCQRAGVELVAEEPDRSAFVRVGSAPADVWTLFRPVRRRWPVRFGLVMLATLIPVAVLSGYVDMFLVLILTYAITLFLTFVVAGKSGYLSGDDA